MITLEEARARIGDGVVYRPVNQWGRPAPGTRPEDGVIVRVNDTYVFVLYRGDTTAKATHPNHLTFAFDGLDR